MKQILFAVLLSIAALPASATIIKLDGCIVEKVILKTNKKGKIVIKRVVFKNKGCAITIEDPEQDMNEIPENN